MHSDVQLFLSKEGLLTWLVVSETRRGRCFEKKPYTLVFTKIFYLCNDVKDFVSTYLTLYEDVQDFSSALKLWNQILKFEKIVKVPMPIKAISHGDRHSFSTKQTCCKIPRTSMFQIAMTHAFSIFGQIWNAPRMQVFLYFTLNANST